MNRDETIKRLCALLTKVATKEFNNRIPADCICGENEIGFSSRPVVDENVIAFIEAAVGDILAYG